MCLCKISSYWKSSAAPEAHTSQNMRESRAAVRILSHSVSTLMSTLCYRRQTAATTLTEQLCAYIFLPPTLCRVWLRIWQLHTMPHLLRAWTHSRKSAAISARPISHVHLSPCLKRSLCLVMLRGSGVFASLLLSLKGKLCWKSSGCQILPACRFQLCR